MNIRHSPARAGRTLLVATALLLGAASQAQTQQPAGQTLQTIDARNIRTLVVSSAPLDSIRPERGVLRLMVPRQANLVGVQQDKDGFAIALGVRVQADTRELFEYYRRLMAAQGFAVASVSYSIEPPPGVREQPDYENVEATFTRVPGSGPLAPDADVPEGADAQSTDRVEFLLDREGPYSYVVYVGPSGAQAPADRPGLAFDEPLYAGEHEQISFALYGPVGVAELPDPSRDQPRLRLAAPEDVRGFRLERRGQGRFEYRFSTDMNIQQVFDEYAEALRQSGFERAGGQLGPNGGRVVFTRGNERVALNFTRLEGGRYAVEVTLSP